MKKKDVYKLREIIQALQNLDDNDRDPMQKDKKVELFKKAVALCNDYIDKMRPL